MASSVTRHADKSPVANWQFLLAGVDTLDVGLYVSWNPQWEFLQARLETWKGRAAGSDGHLINALPIGPVIMLAGGKPPMFRYHLQFPEFHLFLSAADAYRTSPNAYVSISAETLWKYGVEGSVSLVWSMIEDLGGQVDQIQPSRVDLCVDFLIPGGLSTDFLSSHRVSHSRATRHYENGDSLESFYVGSPKSQILARIYDKGVEIEKSKKPWFKQLWHRDSGENVWRVEFQMRRPALKAFRIDDVDTLRERLAGIWQTLTTRWLSLRLSGSQTARRALHPWWQDVQACAKHFGEPIAVDRLALEPSDSAEWHEKHISGCLSSYAAIKDLGSLPEAVDVIAQRLLDQVDPNEFRDRISLKAIKLGKQPPNDEQAPDSEDRDGGCYV